MISDDELKRMREDVDCLCELSPNDGGKLLDEIDRWKEEYFNVCKFATDYEYQREAWKARAERLAKALGFYAHPDNYPTNQQYQDISPRAHEALAEYRESLKGKS